MTEVIENQFLKVEISELGAELKSVFNKENQSEYLWQGDPEFWPRRAPVLFPIVGRLKNNTYKYQDGTWELSQHGFVRDTLFQVKNHTKTSVTYGITQSQESLKKYPFDFELLIKYTLKERVLLVNYQIGNVDNKRIYFSIGGHPGFNCPLNNLGDKFSDYFLEFEKEENAERHLLTDGLFNGKMRKVLDNEKQIELNEELFAADAIVFKNLESSWVKLKSRNSDYELKFNFRGFPFLGIWKKKDAPFICIEPWFGLADSLDSNGNIEDKEGIIALPEGKIFNCEYSIEINS